MKVWLHVHSAESYDGKCSIEEILSSARRHGVEAVFMSEHSDFWTQERFNDYVTRLVQFSEKKPWIIPGIEITAACGSHVLCFGLSTWIEPRQEMGEICRKAMLAGALVVLAHPRRSHLRDVGGYQGMFHGLEVWNVKRSHLYPNDDVLRCVSDSRNLLAFLGLDAHELSDFRAKFTLVKRSPVSIQELLCDLKNGDFAWGDSVILGASDGNMRSRWFGFLMRRMEGFSVAIIKRVFHRVCPGLTQVKRVLRSAYRRAR